MARDIRARYARDTPDADVSLEGAPAGWCALYLDEVRCCCCGAVVVVLLLCWCYCCGGAAVVLVVLLLLCAIQNMNHRMRAG